MEEWELVNSTTTDHPFHIHTNPFQIVSRNDVAVTADSLADVAILPKSETLKFRIRFDDFDGKTVYHCHNLFHEDQGMMPSLTSSRRRRVFRQSLRRQVGRTGDVHDSN